MISINNLKLSFGSRVLFKDVNLKLFPGNCYGLIGANGSGKSTFLKILSKEQDYDTGEIVIPKKMRMAVLTQNQFAYDEHTVLQTVLMGHEELYAISKERDDLYSKEEMTDAEGMRVAELEGEFGELGGYEIESDIGVMLSGLGVGEELFELPMGSLEPNMKVRILLAQALFGNPDILILDEPTNNLDMESINWLEHFLYRFENMVIVASHDRHFLNKVCTQMIDIDFQEIRTYVGNYAFWQQASQLVAQQQKDQKKKAEVRATELKQFIERFSSNAARSKQATARKKELEKLDLKNLPHSSRRYPFVGFTPDRDTGNIVLEIEGLKATLEEEELFQDFNFVVNPGDKIAFVGSNNNAKSGLFKILTGEAEPEAGSYRWGVTMTKSYLPKESSSFFEDDINMTDWLMQYAVKEEDQNLTRIRSLLGRMLFSGDDSLKSVKVLSGGEKVRCLLSRMMLSGANALILDHPTAHLDLESITALNDGLIKFSGILLFASHDHELISSVANRIVEFTPLGIIDQKISFENYLEDERIKELRQEMYGDQAERLTL